MTRPAAPDTLPLNRFTRSELIGGIITSMMGEGCPHAGAVDFLADELLAICPPNLKVRVRTRVDLPGETEVYPDILVEKAGTKPFD